MNIKHSLSLTNSPQRSQRTKDVPANSPTPPATSSFKYLLHSNHNLTIGSEPNRSPEQIQIISNLLEQCSIFGDIGLELSQGDSSMQEICNGVVLMYCESPHIMQVKDNELYIFFEGQGFEYMQNHFENDRGGKYKIYENNQYIMLRKINTNEYFLSLQDYNLRYHSPQKKYQLMVDENTLIGKISDELFFRLFQVKILERQKGIVAFLKRIDIFSGLPNPFFLEFTKFISEEERKSNEKIIGREEKSKFVYLIRTGEVQVRYYSDKNSKSTSFINQNYVISSGKLYTPQKMGPFQTFGMDLPDSMETNSDKQIVCLSDCSFYIIDKRLLAIIITSFELQFQHRHKLFAAVNINSQIKGQSYCSPEQELLLKNAERIKTSERKIRDIKLHYLSSNKVKKEKEKEAERMGTPASTAMRKTVAVDNVMTESKAINSPERMTKTADGRFRTVSETKFMNNFALLKQDKYNKFMSNFALLNDDKLNLFNRHGHGSAKLSQIELMAMDNEGGQVSPVLRYSNAFEYRDKLQGARFTKTALLGSERVQSSNKFVPKVQSKSVYGGGRKSNMDMIGVFLDRKIKNEIMRKAQKVRGLNQSEKALENKNLKRLFACREGKLITAMSELDKRTIAEDIIERMSDLRANPLLLQIEGERRKIERQMKLMERKSKMADSPDRKYKKEDELILIKNNQDD